MKLWQKGGTQNQKRKAVKTENPSLMEGGLFKD